MRAWWIYNDSSIWHGSGGRFSRKSLNSLWGWIVGKGLHSRRESRRSLHRHRIHILPESHGLLNSTAKTVSKYRLVIGAFSRSEIYQTFQSGSIMFNHSSRYNHVSKYITNQQMQLSIYDVLYSQNSQQHVSADILLIFRVMLLYNNIKIRMWLNRATIVFFNVVPCILIISRFFSPTNASFY
jgi:hypothetical protein